MALRGFISCETWRPLPFSGMKSAEKPARSFSPLILLSSSRIPSLAYCSSPLLFYFSTPCWSLFFSLPEGVHPPFFPPGLQGGSAQPSHVALHFYRWYFLLLFTLPYRCEITRRLPVTHRSPSSLSFFLSLIHSVACLTNRYPQVYAWFTCKYQSLYNIFNLKI